MSTTPKLSASSSTKNKQTFNTTSATTSETFFDGSIVRKISILAHLEIPENEINKYAKELNDIMDYVKKIKEVPTENIEPTSQVTGLENITREDEVKPSLSQEEVLANTKSQYNGLFRVKGVLK